MCDCDTLVSDVLEHGELLSDDLEIVILRFNRLERAFKEYILDAAHNPLTARTDALAILDGDL